MKSTLIRLSLVGLAAALVWSGTSASAIQSRKQRGETANAVIVRRFVEEVINQGKVDLADKYVAAGAVDHQMPGQGNGPEVVKKMVRMMKAGFPDARITIDDLIAAGDRVVIRSTFHGTQKGEFMGIAPSGKPVSMSGIDIMRVVNGKLVEHWGNEDDLGMMQQLGAIPQAAGGTR